MVVLGRGPIESVIRASATLEAESEVGVVAEAARRVQKIHVEEGDMVKTGQLLLRLQDDEQLSIVDQRTGLMWQRSGIDITSIRSINKKIIEINNNGFCGYHDWRLPSIEEAMSLMEHGPNEKDIHLNSNFSKEQPFIFTSAQRRPGGYWFVDYKQGRAFWSSGTIPGAFGRLCRNV